MTWQTILCKVQVNITTYIICLLILLPLVHAIHVPKL